MSSFLDNNFNINSKKIIKGGAGSTEELKQIHVTY